MSDQPVDGVVCRISTRARRFPKVVGIIGGKKMPWPSTYVQLGVFISLAVGLLQFHSLWAPFLPAPIRLLVLVGVPVGGWVAVRYWQPEDRTPTRAAFGWLNYALRPRAGSCHGRPVRRGGAVAFGGRFFCSGRS